MKRQFMKSLMALCTGVMTLVAASSLFVSCYDDSALRDSVNKLDKRLQVVEQLKADLDALTAKVNGLYTLQFDVTSEGKVQYSFDGKSWTTTDIVLAEGCDCPEVSIVDNGETVTVKIGNAELTLEKPQEIVFEIRAGKVYFLSETTSAVAIKSSGIEDVTVMSAPKGWYAEVGSDGLLYITAPDYNSTLTYDPETYDPVVPAAAATGFVKVHACSAEGKCMVGKVAVEVAEHALVVKISAGKATYEAVAEDYAPSFYYGVSTKDAYEAEINALVQANEDMNWDLLDTYSLCYEGYAELSIAEALGTELEVGEEYVAWALVDARQMNAVDAVLSFYTHYSIEVTEVEEERTANNITVNVNVEGLDSYVALATPALWCDDPDYTKEMMVEALVNGEFYGKLMTESYSGDVLEIADGTNYYMGGSYSPECVCYLFLLPIDGRPMTDYSAADVLMYEYQTLGLTAGGSVDVTAVEVTEYDGFEFDYDIYDYVPKHFVLDPYSQLGVELSFSSESWETFYYQFMDAELYAAADGDDEVLVSLLLEGYGVTSSDLFEYPSWPVITETFKPATTKYFVAFAVDSNAKYGQLVKLELATDELVYSDIMWEDGSYTTNLNADNVLKNTTSFELTPNFDENVLSYKYLLSNVTYYNRFEGMADDEMAEAIYFASDAVTVAADELVDGKIVVNDHNYSNDYFFAIIPVTEDGPGHSALMLNYTCVFAIDEVITEGADYEATEPGIVVNMPTKFQYSNYDGDDPFYGFEPGNSFNPNKQYYYQLDYNINPVEGTEVCAVLVVNGDYEIPETVEGKASALWNEELGSYYTVVTTEAVKADSRILYQREGNPVPDLYLCVSWKDAEGNYYYKEYSLQKDLEALYELCNTPDGKQWDFDWSDMGMQMGLEHMYSVLDFGVSAPNYFMAGVDYEAIYGPEAAGMWMASIEGYYEIEITDETSGKIWLLQPDWESDEMVRAMYIEYYDYTGITCTFNDPNEAFYLNDVKATLRTETVTVMSQCIGM